MKTLRDFPANGLVAARVVAGITSVDATGRAAVAATPRKKVRLVSLGMGALLFADTRPSWARSAGARTSVRCHDPRDRRYEGRRRTAACRSSCAMSARAYS